MTAVDSDGDASAPATLTVEVVDDEPILFDKNISRTEGQNGKTVWMFDDPNIDGDRVETQGADNGVVTSIEAQDEEGRDIQFRLESGDIVDSVDLEGETITVTVIEIVGNQSQDLGQLEISPNGRARFTPEDFVDHSAGDKLKFTVNVTATDADLDTVTEQLNITIKDKKGEISDKGIIGIEDAGRDDTNEFDNLTGLDSGDLDPIKVTLKVELFDIDRGESISDIRLQNIGDHNGTFYYLDGSVLVPLDTNNSSAILNSEDDKIVTSLDGSELTVENLFFVPDRHFATDEDGIDIQVSVTIKDDSDSTYNISSSLNINIQSIADKPEWSQDSIFDYTEAEERAVVEDGDNLELSISASSQDTNEPQPETITYRFEFIEGEGNAELVYSDGTALDTIVVDEGTPDEVVYYIVDDATRIGDVEVDPIDNFSGTIKLRVVAIAEETVNPLSTKETKESDPRDIVIEVTPEADKTKFGVKRVKIFEDGQTDFDYDASDKLFLSNVITGLDSTQDTDSSEALFVRISDISDPTVVLVDTDPSSITVVESSPGVIDYYEIPVSALGDIEVKPLLHSNVDFTFNVQGIVKDSATLSDGTVVTDVRELSENGKTVYVDIKGVADEPVFKIKPNPDGDDTIWMTFEEGEGENLVKGVETTILENTQAEINFTAISGERLDNESDTSESISLILTGVPEGVTIADEEGSPYDLIYIGDDDDTGFAMYEINIPDLRSDFIYSKGVTITPPESSTENIVISATIVVTENDGHYREFEQEIRVNVAPVIDTAGTYERDASGLEDQLIDIAWQPVGVDYPDSDEIFTRVEIGNIPDDVQVFVDGELVVVVDGTIVFEPSDAQTEQEFAAEFLNTSLQLLPGSDSTDDFQLTTLLTVKEYDAEYIDDSSPGEGVAEGDTISGVINVSISPVVESEGDLYIVNQNRQETGDVADAQSDLIFNFVVNRFGDADPDDIGIDDNNDDNDTDSQVDFIVFGTEGQANKIVPVEVDPDWDDQETPEERAEREYIESIIIDLKPEVYLGLESKDDLDDLTDEQQDRLNDFLDQFKFDGAINLGLGIWMVVDTTDDASNQFGFSLSIPEGLQHGEEERTSGNNRWTFGVTGLAVDDGELDEGERGEDTREIDVTIVASASPAGGSGGGTTPDTVAAEIIVEDDGVVVGQEDTSIDIAAALMGQGSNVLSVSGDDSSGDGITVILDPSSVPGGFNVPEDSGLLYNYVEDVYFFTASIDDMGNIINVPEATLAFAEDLAGDFLLPIKVITTDSQSGDTSIAQLEVPVALAPLVDVESSDQPEDNSLTPQLGIVVKATYGLDSDKQPTDNELEQVVLTDGNAYEDGLVELDLSLSFADSSTSTDEGLETVNTVTLTLASADVGTFANADGESLGTSLVLPNADYPDANAALSSIFFKPAADYPALDNQVQIDISGTIQDLAKFDQTDAEALFGDTNLVEIDGVQYIAVEQPFNGSVSFEVTPVVDPVVISGSEVSGDEDTWISLGQDGSGLSITLGDLDALNDDGDNSEEFISVKITNVPDDFLVQSISSDYVVKNNGGGEWSIRLNDPTVGDLDLDKIQVKPAEQFSGDVNLGVSVFVREKITQEPEEFSSSITLKVNPIGDVIDADIETSTLEVNEGEDVVVEINASVVDNAESLGDNLPSYEENAPEQIRLTVSGVPLGASITVGSQTMIQDSDLEPFVFDVASTSLASLVFNSGDNDNTDWSGELTVSLQAVDTGLDGTVSFGDAITEVVTINVIPVNDTPTTSNVVLDDIEEDSGSFEITAAQLLSSASDIETESADLTISGLVLVDDSVGELSESGGGVWSFTPAENYYGTVELSYSISDDGATNANDDVITIDGAATFNVIATNDAPTIGTDSVTSTIDDAVAQKIEGISIVDVDYAAAYIDDDITVTLTVNDGVLSINPASPEGVTVSPIVDGIELVGSPSDINAILSDVSNSNGIFVDASSVDASNIELTINVNDGGVYYENAAGMALSTEQKLDIAVNQVNDAPTLTLDPASSYARNIYASRNVATQGIALIGLVAMLVDSNEVLSLEITVNDDSGQPDSTSVISTDNTDVSLSQNGNVWTVTANDPAVFDGLNDLQISGLGDGDNTVSVVAVSNESDGSEARSAAEIISIGVGPGNFNQQGETDDVWILGPNDGETLVGGSGDDVIEGSDGDDVLIGGLGSDILTGGDGADTFKWDTVSNDSVDVIKDFSVADSDVIDLTDVVDFQDGETIDDVLSHITASVDNGNITLEINSGGPESQTIVVENVENQVDLSAIDLNGPTASDEIVTKLISDNIIQYNM